MISYPGWWKGGRWDAELLINDLFTFPENLASVGLEGILCEPFPPGNTDREAWLKQGNGYLLVHRNGGRLNKSSKNWVDECVVTVGALTKSRSESNTLQSYIASVLCEFEDGDTVRRDPAHAHLSGLSTTFMKVPGEVVGPQLSPELLRDERLVPSVWNIHADWPRGLPDYRQALGLN